MRRPERDRRVRMLLRDPKLLLSLSLLTKDIVKKPASSETQSRWQERMECFLRKDEKPRYRLFCEVRLTVSKLISVNDSSRLVRLRANEKNR